MNFLLVIIELFSLDVTAEALPAKIDRKKSGRRGRPNQSFLHGRSCAVDVRQTVSVIACLQLGFSASDLFYDFVAI